VDLRNILTKEVGGTYTLNVTSGVRKGLTGGSAHVHARRGIFEFSHSESVPTLNLAFQGRPPLKLIGAGDGIRTRVLSLAIRVIGQSIRVNCHVRDRLGSKK
jgi:hypothetical protein